MPSLSSGTVTVDENDLGASGSTSPPMRVKLTKPAAKQKVEKKVSWTDETVDNEHLNKKKSKCCCVFEKQRQMGESSSDDTDDECTHCSGHVELKKK